MSEERREGKRGFELRGWHVIVGIVAVLVILLVLFRVFSHSALERKIAELRAKGYPTTFEELANYNSLPEGVPNAAHLYTQAFDAYQVPLEDEKNLLPYIGPINPNDPITPEIKAAMETFLVRNAKVFESLHQASMMKECRYDFPITGFTTFMNPYFQEIKQCAQLLSIQILNDAITGKAEAACQGAIDQLRLGESVNRDPVLISFLVRIAIDAMAASSVQTILSQLSPTDQELSDLQIQLRQVRSSLRMDRVFIGERCFLFDETGTRQSLGWGTGPFRWLGLIETNRMRCLDYFDQLEAISKLEPEKRCPEYRRIDDDISNLPFWFAMTQILIPAVEQIGMMEVRVIGQMDCARAALGVERFRMAEKRLPETLEELVPKFIEAVPIDPFDGKPLRYKRLEKGYMIYTIGEDGEDNGGAPKGKVEKGANYDWPFTVEQE